MVEICERCGGEIIRSKKESARRPRRFCSRKCMNEANIHGRPLETRFWEKVERGSDSDCWNWTGATTHGGYGVLGIGRERLVRAPRVSYEIHRGPIPHGAIIRHSCDNPRCVNPSHLSTGSMKDNVRDMLERGRNRPHRKLTPEDVAAIRTSTGTVRSVAAQFGVSFAYVSMVRNGLR